MDGGWHGTTEYTEATEHSEHTERFSRGVRDRRRDAVDGVRRPAGRQRRRHEAAADADRERIADRVCVRQQYLDGGSRRRQRAAAHELPGPDDESALLARREEIGRAHV